MTDSERKRAYVADLYSGKGWKQKVSKMSDEQIVAIYLKHQDDGQAPAAYVNDAETMNPLAEQLAPRLFDSGPHRNEDDFPLY